MILWSSRHPGLDHVHNKAVDFRQADDVVFHSESIVSSRDLNVFEFDSGLTWHRGPSFVKFLPQLL